MAEEYCSKVQCPFCGTNDDLKVRPDFSEDEPEKIIAYHVECGICGCKGRNAYPIGWCETEESAIRAWEHRGSIRPVNALPSASSILKFSFEPHGPAGQYALYHGRTPDREGRKICNLYDFSFNVGNGSTSKEIMKEIVDALNNNAHLKGE